MFVVRPTVYRFVSNTFLVPLNIFSNCTCVCHERYVRSLGIHVQRYIGMIMYKHTYIQTVIYTIYMAIYIYIYITQDENTSYFIEILITTDLFRMTSVQLATLIR